MKGKFSSETAERLYGEWNENLHTSDAYDGYRHYGLFIDFDGGVGHILVEDEQGFVDAFPYPDEQIMAEWNQIVTECDKWEPV